MSLSLKQCTKQKTTTNSDAHSIQSTASEKAGQTHINPTTGKPYYYKDNKETHDKRNAYHNPRQMYVAGKYISRSHPLHKAGRYKNWDDAHSHQILDSHKAGYVYAITNMAWPAWVKIGMAVDASDRCKGYQTSCPFRNFKLKYAVASEDRRASEVTAHKLATEIAEERRGEWFKMPVADAIKVLNRLHECN